MDLWGCSYVCPFSAAKTNPVVYLALTTFVTLL